MIIGGIYHGPIRVERVYRGADLIWWAAEEREYGGLNQRVQTVVRATIDQAELEALAMECGASVRMSVAMRQHGMVICTKSGVLLIIEATAHQSPAAVLTPEINARVTADLTARASVARSAAGTIAADADMDATMHAQPVRIHRGALTGRTDPDATMRASPSCPQGMESYADVRHAATAHASPAHPVERQIYLQARTDAQMRASTALCETERIDARIKNTVALSSCWIEMIAVGETAMEIATDAELRAAESLAVALQSMAAAELRAAMVQSPVVGAASESRVALESSATARNSQSRPVTADCVAIAETAAVAWTSLTKNAAGRMAPAVGTVAPMADTGTAGAAARQTVAAATEAAMADDAAKTAVTSSRALTRPAVTMSTWARPIQRGNNLLIRQAINVRQEGSTLYIK